MAIVKITREMRAERMEAEKAIADGVQQLQAEVQYKASRGIETDVPLQGDGMEQYLLTECMVEKTVTGRIKFKIKASSSIYAADADDAEHKARCRKLHIAHDSLSVEDVKYWTMWLADGTLPADAKPGFLPDFDALNKLSAEAIQSGYTDANRNKASIAMTGKTVKPWAAQYGCVDAEKVNDLSGLKITGKAPEVISLIEANKELADAVAEGDKLMIAFFKARVKLATSVVKA